MAKGMRTAANRTRKDALVILRVPARKIASAKGLFTALNPSEAPRTEIKLVLEIFPTNPRITSIWTQVQTAKKTILSRAAKSTKRGKSASPLAAITCFQSVVFRT